MIKHLNLPTSPGSTIFDWSPTWALVYLKREGCSWGGGELAGQQPGFSEERLLPEMQA